VGIGSSLYISEVEPIIPWEKCLEKQGILSWKLIAEKISFVRQGARLGGELPKGSFATCLYNGKVQAGETTKMKVEGSSRERDLRKGGVGERKKRGGKDCWYYLPSLLMSQAQRKNQTNPPQRGSSHYVEQGGGRSKGKGKEQGHLHPMSVKLRNKRDSADRKKRGSP